MNLVMERCENSRSPCATCI
ncbi:rCG39014 [Rattus norvegicus]|uniref:RCG39014 n=1 Tax=Rattus norvegicus TaxID=10116 RepID=A6JY88_RAT|nr:rCG39014 [Rattus norvegicus]